ncbi:MAG: hypothetical protein ACREKF_01805 [Candidatus Methylomirabilales bacterium]
MGRIVNQQAFAQVAAEIRAEASRGQYRHVSDVIGSNPCPEVPGDSPNRVMARSGEAVYVSKTRTVWRFGFLAGSDAARAYGVSVDRFLWLTTTRSGRVLRSVRGFGYSPRTGKCLAEV